MIRLFSFCFLVFLALPGFCQDQITIIEADHQYIQYYGRFDMSNPKLPRFWAPGSYITTRFSGTDCEVFINDQVFEGSSHNYIEVKVDNIDPVRIQLRAKANRIQIAKDLPGGDHTVTITKNTDASVGYLELRGFKCNSLIPPPPIPIRKLEFVGDEITAGTGSDSRYTLCDSAEWYDQSNAYSSFGAITARDLNAQYQLTAISKVGVIKPAGQPGGNMTELFDKVNLYKNDINWDFKKFQPNVVTICLGRNDPLTDSVGFKNNYLLLIKELRTKYPVAHIVCLFVSTGDTKSSRLINFIPAIVSAARTSGDTRVHQLITKGIFNKGCNNLPSMEDQLEISSQLTPLVRQLMAW